MPQILSRKRASRRAAPSIGAMLRVGCATLAVGAVSILVAFHLWLLALRLTTTGAFDWVAALRWGGAALVLSALLALRRVGVPLIGSRQAAVVWLLAALLHVGASAPLSRASSPLDQAPGLLLAVPVASASVLAVVTAVSLATRRLRQGSAGASARRLLGPVAGLVAGVPFDGFAVALAARPPPR